MILIHCCKCKKVVGKAEKLYERLGMTVFCAECVPVSPESMPADYVIPAFLSGFMRVGMKRK